MASCFCAHWSSWLCPPWVTYRRECVSLAMRSVRRARFSPQGTSVDGTQPPHGPYPGTCCLPCLTSSHLLSGLSHSCARLSVPSAPYHCHPLCCEARGDTFVLRTARLRQGLFSLPFRRPRKGNSPAGPAALRRSRLLLGRGRPPPEVTSLTRSRSGNRFIPR